MQIPHKLFIYPFARFAIWNVLFMLLFELISKLFGNFWIDSVNPVINNIKYNIFLLLIKCIYLFLTTRFILNRVCLKKYDHIVILANFERVPWKLSNILSFELLSTICLLFIINTIISISTSLSLKSMDIESIYKINTGVIADVYSNYFKVAHWLLFYPILYYLLKMWMERWTVVMSNDN